MGRGFADFMLAPTGTPVFLGVIVATTTTNNHTTAVPFSNTGTALGGKTILIAASAACHVLTGTTNAADVTTSNGVPLIAGEKAVITMLPNHGWLAVVGAASVKVWELLT